VRVLALGLRWIGFMEFKSTFVVLATMGLVACQADAWGDAPAAPAANDSKQAAIQACSAASTQSVSQVDPSKFPACTGTKGGTGRCVAESSIEDFKGIFETASCSGGDVCAPEPIIEQGTSIQLKTCQVMGKEGRCFWPLAKQMVQYYDMLQSTASECDAGMLCAPCNNPVSNEETGVCKAGSTSATCGAASTDTKAAAPAAPASNCCEGRGQCVPSSVITGVGAQMLSQDSCTGDAQLCAPSEILKSVTPTQCTSGLGLLAGICVSKCTMNSPLASLVQGTCPDGDLCAPCRFLPDGACK
jgi:hypothetical protein